jgi:hypothetical protein
MEAKAHELWGSSCGGLVFTFEFWGDDEARGVPPSKIRFPSENFRASVPDMLCATLPGRLIYKRWGPI